MLPVFEPGPLGPNPVALPPVPPPPPLPRNDGHMTDLGIAQGRIAEELGVDSNPRKFKASV